MATIQFEQFLLVLAKCILCSFILLLLFWKLRGQWAKISSIIPNLASRSMWIITSKGPDSHQTLSVTVFLHSNFYFPIVSSFLFRDPMFLKPIGFSRTTPIFMLNLPFER